ncbi:MAG: methionine gamma-lyase family protein, partial [Cyanobacteria bacterium P01_C01_bin.70]
MNSPDDFLAAKGTLCQTFWEIDLQVKANLSKVLTAMRKHKVGSHHFASVSGYGHNDLGRDTLDRVFADVMQAEAAAVRVQFVSGTHAIACALFGALRPGDELLSVTGSPYDTLEEVIGLRSNHQGSLKEFGITYRELSLNMVDSVDWNQLQQSIIPATRMVFIQRSCGYSWRRSLTIAEIERIVAIVKSQNPKTICFVDNCYGEF